MGDKSGIEWCDATWNPVAGCSRCAPGCENCYAERLVATRLAHLPAYEGLAVMSPHGPRWTGEVRCLPDRLDQPRRWKRPRRIFVNSMSDLFHPLVPFEFIDQVAAVMELCPQHEFIVLTKRGERMRDYCLCNRRRDRIHKCLQDLCSTLDDGTIPGKLDPIEGRKWVVPRKLWARAPAFSEGMPWPPPNVIPGASISNQDDAEKQIPCLMDLAAAGWRTVASWEPATEMVDFEPYMQYPPFHDAYKYTLGDQEGVGIGGVICGGESGPGAREFRYSWALGALLQCQEAEVPFYLKQMGSNPINDLEAVGNFRPFRPRLKDKGGDMDEWPEALRVRQWPERRG